VNNRLFSSGRGFGTDCLRAGWALAVIMLLATIPVFAQQSVGTILGVVKDTSGGTVAGATVTILNTETNLSRSATTGDDGAFRLPSLPVGRYSVKIEKTGFKTETRPGMVLEVAQELVVNASLEVGAATQEVVVTGEAPIVNTTTSSLGGIVNEDKMAELPLNGRDFVNLSLLQPGVTQNLFNGTGGGMVGVWFSTNGAPTRSNYVTLDGASMMNQLGGGTGSEGGTSLGVDGIREYRVITNNFSAEYGMSMGSQMVMSSKGGTNKWHGDVFDYLRNSHLDARNFFDTTQTAGLTASGQQRRLPPYQRNDFGGSFGGPIVKDKAFFYAVYEGLRQNLGFTGIDTVPSAGCHGAAGATILAANCSALPAGTSVVIAPVMATIFNTLIPIPNCTTPNCTTYSVGTANLLSDNYGQIRFDQNISAKDTLFARYTIDQASLNNGSGSIATGDNGPAYPGNYTLQSPSRNQFITLAETHIFSPTLLSTGRLSFSRTLFTNQMVAAPAMTGPLVSFMPGQPMGGFQSVPGLTNPGSPLSAGPAVPNYHIQNVYTLSDDLFYTKGKHAFKFGVLFNRFNQGIGSAQSPNGNSSWASVAAVMQGFYSSYIAQTQGVSQTFDFIYSTIGLYAQDDYRVSSRLTLNLGLRYEFNTTPWELHGNSAAFRNIGTDTASTPGPIIDNPSLKNFSPRIGFAYDPMGNGKTAIRGGFAEVYDVGNIGTALFQGVTSLPPLISQSSVVAPTTTTVLQLPFFSNLPGLPPPNTLQTVDYNMKQTHMFQWNFTVERQLPGSFGLTVSYVGTRGLNLFTELDANPNTPSSFVNGLPQWDPYLCAGVHSLTNTGSCTIATVGSFTRLNPHWLTQILDVTNANSTYHALQVVVNKRLSKGLQLQSSYTWSHSLDTAAGGQSYSADCSNTDMASPENTFNPTINKGPSCFDVLQNWRFNLLYHFPTMKANGFLSKVVNGWWMGNIVSINTGYPFSIGESTNRSLTGENSGKVINELGSVATAADIAANCSSGAITATCKYIPVPFNHNTVNSPHPDPNAIAVDWFNPNMFELQPVGQYGNASRGLMRGPGLGSWDFSAVKDTALPFLGENGSLQFRAEFFNFLNRANFGAPQGLVFTGTPSLTNLGPFTEAPGATAGRITTTSTNSRQIQFALKLIF
jgi:hypothetical protein